MTRTAPRVGGAVVGGDDHGQDARRVALRADREVADDIATLPVGVLRDDGQVDHRLAAQGPREQGLDRGRGVGEHLFHGAPEVLADGHVVHRRERGVDVDVAAVGVDEGDADRRAVEGRQEVGGDEGGGHPGPRHPTRCTSRAPA